MAPRAGQPLEQLAQRQPLAGRQVDMADDDMALRGLDLIRIGQVAAREAHFPAKGRLETLLATRFGQMAYQFTLIGDHPFRFRIQSLLCNCLVAECQCNAH